MKNYKQVNEFHCTCDEFPSYSGRSNCCGAPVLDDSDICQDCKEHCARVCPECGGWGEIINRKRQHLSTIIDEPYTKCLKCGGTGEIENE